MKILWWHNWVVSRTNRWMNCYFEKFTLPGICTRFACIRIKPFALNKIITISTAHYVEKMPHIALHKGPDTTCVITAAYLHLAECYNFARWRGTQLGFFSGVGFLFWNFPRRERDATRPVISEEPEPLCPPTIVCNYHHYPLSIYHSAPIH